MKADGSRRRKWKKEERENQKHTHTTTHKPTKTKRERRPGGRKGKQKNQGKRTRQRDRTRRRGRRRTKGGGEQREREGEEEDRQEKSNMPALSPLGPTNGGLGQVLVGRGTGAQNRIPQPLVPPLGSCLAKTPKARAVQGPRGEHERHVQTHLEDQVNLKDRGPIPLYH